MTTKILAGRLLDDVKTALQVQVDQAAETARLRFLTPGSGQALEYAGTEEEARALQAAYAAAGEGEDPYDAAAYPWIEAEVLAATAQLGFRPPVQAVLAEILAEANGWKQVGAAIKALRRGAKMRIAAATTIAEAEAAAVVHWPGEA